MIDRVSSTTPAKEIARIEHRQRILAQALADEPRGRRARMNAAELAHLDEQHAAWSEEQEANRRAWIVHHRRAFSAHMRLARNHHVQLMRLLRSGVSAGVHRFENSADTGDASGDAA